jgi:hypothetical protein
VEPELWSLSHRTRAMDYGSQTMDRSSKIGMVIEPKLLAKYGHSCRIILEPINWCKFVAALEFDDHQAR